MDKVAQGENKRIVVKFGLLIIGPYLFVCFLLLSSASNAAILHGFFEGAYGMKRGDDRAKRNNYNLFEGRLQLRYTYQPYSMEEWAPELSLKGDLIADAYDETIDSDVREVNILFTPLPFLDVKLGRQILTWGTGDLLFINDLFPKDYVSFFIGRDDEYLKLPSDALRLSFFTALTSFDMVVIPFFAPDKNIKGDRLSFYDILSGRIAGEDSTHTFSTPSTAVGNAEFALRAYRTFGSYEGALYAFAGFFKEPFGIKNQDRGEFFYPRLNVYGASLRGPVFGGIGNIELGIYDSREDRGGGDRLIENPSIKYLLGYTRDLGGDFKTGIQYMVEEILHYDAYRGNLIKGDIIRDQFRQLFTVRFTKLFSQQTIEAGIFLFYSPSDEDIYLRPRIGYRVTDNFMISVGGNIFAGRKDYTEFGQLDGNNNFYTRVRYNF